MIKEACGERTRFLLSSPVGFSLAAGWVRKEAWGSQERRCVTAHPCSAVSSGKLFPRGRFARSQNKVFRSVRETSDSVGEDGKSAPERTFAGSAVHGGGGEAGRKAAAHKAACTRDSVVPGSSPLGGEVGGARTECSKRGSRHPKASQWLATRIARCPRQDTGNLQGSSLPQGLGESPRGCRNRSPEEIRPGVGHVPGCLREL